MLVTDFVKYLFLAKCKVPPGACMRAYTSSEWSSVRFYLFLQNNSNFPRVCTGHTDERLAVGKADACNGELTRLTQEDRGHSF